MVHCIPFQIYASMELLLFRIEFNCATINAINCKRYSELTEAQYRRFPDNAFGDRVLTL